MKVCDPMAGALSGRSQVRKPCRTRQRAGPQGRLLTYLGHKEASCVSPAYLRPEDQLVVWKVDRLGRSLREMINTAHQGRRMKSASQKSEHVIIVPGGLLATRPHADPG